MANKDIFCAVPWHNSHLYWDGTYGACCSEKTKPQGLQKNLADTNIQEWHNGEAMRNFRLRILGNEKLPECRGCYYEEMRGHESRRIKENFKVAIFTKQAFEKSFSQSNWYDEFSKSAASGESSNLPIDLHVDFGNECNLACKMCAPGTSSKIASFYTKWNIAFDKFDNWTSSETLYQKFLSNIKLIPKIKRIHVMGGEPLINKKFYDFVDWLIDNNYKDLSLSFVSNGTKINQTLIKKLKFFQSVDIEISLESITSNNHYIRQGSETDQVLNNIVELLNHRSPSFNIVLRSVPQLFSVNNYFNLIEFAHKNNLIIQSIPLTDPEYLAINILPKNIRLNLLQKYEETKNKILSTSTSFKTLTTGRDATRLDQQLVKECETIMSMLKEPEPENVDVLRKNLVFWMTKWDKVFNLNAFEFFPEYSDFLQDCGYRV
jgi:molybdenum cofactor biosynthesis enzyme MoaA